MALKPTSPLALITVVGFLACSTPTTSHQAAVVPTFELSAESPFHWNINKQSINLSIKSNHFNKISNSMEIKAPFAQFGEVEYQLFFDFDDDTLTNTRITSLKSGDIDKIIFKLYDIYSYLLTKNISFTQNNRVINKSEFTSLIQRQNRLSGSSKYVYMPLISVSPKNLFMIYIGNPSETTEKQYEAVLQISRS